jgi:hypothetical protein
MPVNEKAELSRKVFVLYPLFLTLALSRSAPEAVRQLP